jgi:hypothetical protein
MVTDLRTEPEWVETVDHINVAREFDRRVFEKGGIDQCAGRDA